VMVSARAAGAFQIAMEAARPTIRPTRESAFPFAMTFSFSIFPASDFLDRDEFSQRLIGSVAALTQ
jgi:hypothetical protein